MSLGSVPGGPLRRVRTDTLSYSTMTLTGVSALSLLLWVAAGSQAATAVSQAGRPGYEAQVVACPQPGGNAGRCDVRLTRDGHHLDALLVRPGFYAPDVGDHLTVTVSREASPEGPAEVTPSGSRLMVHTLALLALAVTFTVWTVQRFRRFQRALARVDAPRVERPPDVERGALFVALPPPREKVPARTSRVPRG